MPGRTFVGALQTANPTAPAEDPLQTTGLYSSGRAPAAVGVYPEVFHVPPEMKRSVHHAKSWPENV